MPTSEKIDKVEELTAAMAGAKAIYLADFTGIDVAQVTGLRNQLREADVSYQVVKNRLAKRAAVAAGIEGLSEHFIGPTAIAYSTDDTITPAKILQDFAEKDAHFTINTGIMDGKILSGDQVRALAKLPSREELLGKVVGSIQSPLYGFAAVLNGLLRNLVGVVAAIEEKQRTGSGD